MTAPMPFLQRLAPARDTAGKVRAALAPRFAASPAIMEGEDASPATPESRSAPKFEPGSVLARPAESTARGHGAETASSLPPRSVAMRPPLSKATPPHATGTRPHDGPTTRVQAQLQAPSEAAVGSALQPPRIAVRQVQEKHGPGDPRPSRLRHVRSTAEEPSDTAPPLALRESVVEHRMAAPAPQSRTVLNVTIDRIDVRLPSPPAPQRPSSRPRGPSTMPLADYLRQRDRARGGNGS